MMPCGPKARTTGMIWQTAVFAASFPRNQLCKSKDLG